MHGYALQVPLFYLKQNIQQWTSRLRYRQSPHQSGCSSHDKQIRNEKPPRDSGQRHCRSCNGHATVLYWPRHNKWAEPYKKPIFASRNPRKYFPKQRTAAESKKNLQKPWKTLEKTFLEKKRYEELPTNPSKANFQKKEACYSATHAQVLSGGLVS